MPSSVIKATRSTITNRLPVCGFAIRTGRNPWYEVALATDPQLFAPEAKERRRPGNFFSTRATGPLPAERGEAVYLVSPEVLGRFAGQPRLYYALATFPDRSRSAAEVPAVPPDATSYVSLSQSFTGQSLRRLIGVPSAGAGLSGSGGYGSTSPEALSWAGDTARPGTQPVTRGGSGAPNGRAGGPGVVAAPPPSPGAATPPAAQGLDYDDGFGRAFWAEPRQTPLSADIPLDPGTGGRSIGPDALATGDIILSTTDAAISAAIRSATSSPVSHALLYVGDGQVVEAIAAGVQLRTLEEAVAGATVAVAFRHPSITSDQALRVRDFAGQQLGRPYDTWGVVRQAAFRLDRAAFCSGKTGEELERCVSWAGRVNLGTGSNDTFFCSQLVLAAFDGAGIPLTSTPPSWSSPGEIAELSLSGTLGYVGHLKAPPLAASQSARAVGRPFASRGAAVRPFAGPVDIDWDEVVLTPDTGQPNAYAAAAAMVVGWRDRVCLTPDTILDAVTRQGGDPADREAYATAWDLVHVRGAAYETVELKGMIEGHGPLWAANGDRNAANAGHAFVITGVCGDGTAAGTNVCIDDPWGQVTGSPAAATSNPAPGGPGTRTSITYQDLAAQFPPRPGLPPTHAWLELLHARDITGRVPGRVGCAVEAPQSLGNRIRPMGFPARSGRPLSQGAAFGSETDAEGNEDHGIDGPIPDEAASTVAASLARARALTAAEYPQASRFVAARWFRVPATPRTLSRVVIHITDGGSNINGTVGWFQNPVNADGTPRRVSAHYVVGRDGEVVQMVEHANVAWHASSANGDSIGIEHCANTRGLNPTPAQYGGSAALVRWLCDTYGIPIDRDHVLGHSEADPRTTHTGCPNAVWDWSTFMSLVQGASGAVSPPSGQALGRAFSKPSAYPAPAPGRPRPLVYRPQRATPLGMVSVHWDEVQLVAQSSGDNCWAAAASMVVGWRDRMSIDPALLPRPADIPALARAFDLEAEPGQSYTVDGFADLLTRKGPLWVAALVPGFHAIVVTGIQGDGDPDTTLVYVSDPWERDPGSPGAPGPYRASPGSGSRYTLTYRNFVNEYEAVPLDPSYHHITVQILHARETGGRAPGVVPTTQSLGLRSRAASALRYSRGLAVSAFSSEAMERMRATFLANKAAAHRLNCIEIMNAGLRSLFDARLRDAGGGNLALGSSVQATMGKLQDYGLADAPTDFEYFDAAGRPTRGVIRPETLRESVEAWILLQCEANQQSAYYTFGLSVMDGYHSVLIPVAFSGTGDPSTKVYWADQIYSGWDDVTGGLDARITDRTQRWWDGATPVKPRTRCRVWPLLG